MLDWNPALCLHFADERTRPAAELPARAPLGQARREADLVCGPGHSTGIDNFRAMLEAVRLPWPGAGLVPAEFFPWTPQGGAPDLTPVRTGLQWMRAHALRVTRLCAPLAQTHSRLAAAFVQRLRSPGRQPFVQGLPAISRLSLAVQRKP